MTRVRGLAYAYPIETFGVEGVRIRTHMYKHTQFSSQHIRIFVEYKGKNIMSYYC